MPIKIGTLLNDWAQQTGYDTSRPEFVELLSANLDLPDAFADHLSRNLFTFDAAKNNIGLKNHFRRSILDGVDGAIQKVIDTASLSEDQVTGILSNNNTYERIGLLANAIKEVEAAKSGAKGGERAQLQEQINALNQEKSSLISAQATEIQNLKNANDLELVDFYKRHSIGLANLATDQFDKEVIIDLASKYIDTELSTIGAKTIRKDGKIKLVSASDGAIDFFENNKQVSFDDIRDRVLAKHKLVQVTKPVETKPTAGQPGPQPTTSPSNLFSSKMTASMNDYKED